MFKKFLLSFLAMIVGFFAVSAQTSVIVDVDNAANVRVYTYQKGDLSLVDGMNRITDLSEADSPLVIEPAANASIVSVTKNGTDLLSPSGDGLYRVAIESMMLQIVTSGGGSATQEVGLNVSGMGNPGSFTLKAGGADIPVGQQVMVSPGTEVTVIPATGYEVEKVTDLYMTSVGTPGAGGTQTFTVGNEDVNWYYVYTKVTGLSFTIETDYAPNVTAILNAKPDGSADSYKYIELNANGSTKVVTTKDMEPLVIQATEGAEILSVTRNGEPVNYFEPGVSWVTGYVTEFEEGDVFAVTTKGRAVDYTFVSAPDNAPLESYIFKLADGTILNVSGTEQKLSLPLGSKVYIEGRPGTDYKYVVANSYAPDMREWIRVTENGSATVYGTRSTGVTVNVDAASRVVVKQANGRGDALTLSDGENSFELSSLQNSLAVSPTEGNQIASVTLDGTPVEPGRNGVYLATVAEGSYLDIKSRKIPGDVAVSFVLNDGAQISWLTATLNDEPCDIAATMTVKSGSTMTLAPTLGYRIDAVTTMTPGCNVVKDTETGVYILTVGEEADAAMFSVVVNEITAQEGDALVIIKTESPFFNFLERTPEGTTVKTLDSKEVNEVKIGNSIYFYTFTSGVYIKSVKVNGKEIAEAVDKRNFSVVITENCTVEIESYQKVEVATVNTINDVAHITIGDITILDSEGNPVRNLECEVGQTITFKVETTVGYKFVNIEKFYPEPVTAIDGLTYTITSEDAEMGMIQFRGVFVKDEEHSSLTIRTSPAYEIDPATGKPMQGEESIVAYVYVYIGDDISAETGLSSNFVTEYTAEVGSQVHLVCFAREDYQLKNFCLAAGYPNSTFPGSFYTVSADDANSEGVIWITGVVEKKSSGIDGISAEGSLSYDRATATINATSTTVVYTVSGAAVLTLEAGETSLATLPAGVYIAVAADGKTLKFVK